MIEWLVPLAHGVGLAAGLILPPGPQNIFVAAQGAAHAQWRRAWPAVITAAASDTALIVAGALGIAAWRVVAPRSLSAILVVGALWLVVAAARTWRDASAADAPLAAFSPGRQVAAAAAISLLNPHAVMDTVMVLGPSSQLYAGGAKVAFTAGAVAVSWAWFVLLAFSGRHLLRRVPARAARRLCAALLALAALLLLRGALRALPGAWS